MFYVYEHIRPDTGAIFYVGKGKEDRFKLRFSRNKYWQNVVNKAGGFEARKIVENIDEELALLVEVERIDQLRRLGVNLTNLTAGGEGCSNPTEEVRRKIGVRHSQESYDRALAKRRLLKVSEETRKKQSLARTGHKNVMYGKTHSESAREKIRAARLSAPRITCPHCDRVGDSSNMRRWHFDNCKLKGKNEMSKTNTPQIVTIDGVEYDVNGFNENQLLLLNHTADLDRKIGSTQFQLQQLNVGKDAFLTMLKEALKEQPAEAEVKE
jgi:hypothetical protein